ncbi:LysR family transcriptional regulator [Roseomonas sp. SSH11]|uniref:LysR family transcriptional regulator n=1 Tax=Pararoseomonas baculiformis TaxID=2820812 RepID=A0ABS4AD11_9PROT|nr:LysR family transcriptional regulator [Pararoseomonas baculiformis]MBP0444907.1 LysR family transcriptional regulator [Pararoseomonas baculiformis]
MLDLESVRLFVLAVEFGNLTRAAEAAGTVQPAVSARLKALEARLGRRLLDRSPRFVRPTAEGIAFLARARALLAAHDEALRLGDAPAMRVAIGLSDHAVGLGLPALLARLRAALPPHALLELHSGASIPLRERFEEGALDAVILRREAGGAEGEVLGEDPLGWRGAPDFTLPAGAAVPLALLAPPCGVRAAAERALDAAGRPWREAYRGGSCAMLLAGAGAGLGLAPMGRISAGGAPDLGPELGLPPLPGSEIVLLGRAGSAGAAAAIRVLAAGMRAALSPGGSPPAAPPGGKGGHLAG